MLPFLVAVRSEADSNIESLGSLSATECRCRFLAERIYTEEITKVRITDNLYSVIDSKKIALE